MKTKTSGKAITSITLVTIMVASVMVAMVGTAAAAQGGTKYNVIRPGGSQKVLMGQDLEFVGFNMTPPTVYRYEAGDQANTYAATLDGGRYFLYNINWPTAGAYYVNGGPDGWEAPLSYEDPDMPLRLRVKDKDVTSLAVGTLLNVDVGGIDLFDLDRVDLEIIGPDGQVSEKNGLAFRNITVSTLKTFKALNTTGLKVGHYTFQVVIDKPDFACGLSGQSVKKGLNIKKSELTITAATTEVPELETVSLTVTGVAGNNITMEVESMSPNAYFPKGIDDNPRTETTRKFFSIIDDDGTMNYAVEFNDTGAYTVRASETNDTPTYDNVDITVTEKQVTFDVPTSVELGENFTLQGTANTGDTVDIAVDDHVCAKLNDLVINGTGGFEVAIDTRAADVPAAFTVSGAANLKAYIDRAAGTGDISDTERADGTATIYLLNQQGGGIDVSASEVTVGKNETVILTIAALPDHNVSVTTADTAHTVFEYNRYDFTGTSSNVINIAPADTISIPADIGDCDSQTKAKNIHGVWQEMAADGTTRFAVHFADTGTYTITATDYGADYPTATRLDEKGIEITVIEKNVTFEVPSMVIIGETLTIRGTSKCGDTVTIAVADQIVQKLDQIVIDGNGEFTVEIDTTVADAPAEFKIPGAVSLRAFIDRAETGDISPDEIDDGSTEVFMVRPWLTAGVSTDSVDLGDEFTVSGTAKGTMYVDILIVGPKGYGGSNIETEEKGLYNASVGVSASEGTYSQNISVGDDVDNGRYLVVVLSPGSDGVYGCDSGGMMGTAQSKYSVASPTPTPPTPTPAPRRRGNCRGGVTIEEALDCYTLNGRTQYEMLEIFDNIVGLSDDLIWVSYITVGKQETLILDPIADVSVSEPLEVTGETSREDGAIIWVTVAKPYYMMVPKPAIAKDNTFNATFDTTGAQLGSYVVTAMDGYGYTAARIVNVIAETAAQTYLYNDAVGSYLGVTNAQEDTITIQKMYTYSCPGTGGHSEYAAFYDRNGTKLGEGRWNGYPVADLQYITFDAPLTLEIGKTYNYTIKTGSYPQIIHKHSHAADNGTITCTEFTDANGNTYTDWIPAIRLE